jgi:pimeloyl-ACP methyl ester carboxylesterase
MTAPTHVDAPTRFVDAGGIRYAYRRFGSDIGVPLIFLQHFRGGMDHWDPLLTDGLGRDRPVILFDNAGVAASSGETPGTFEAMADHVAVFAEAIGLTTMDVLGFSIGGFVAQALTLAHPRLVRKLMLVGTGPRGGVPSTDPRVAPAATRDVPVLEDALLLFFSASVESRAAGRAFWERRHLRERDVDPPSSPEAMSAQLHALADWGHAKTELYADLERIRQPTLVVNGNDDIMVPTINSYHLAQAIPDAQLIIYPDSGHGSQYQYPDRFLLHAREFLDRAVADAIQFGAKGT